MALASSGAPLPVARQEGFAVVALGFAVGLLRIGVLIALIVLSWAAMAQRFHDLGLSGWAILWLLVPVIQFYYVYLLLFKRGQSGENRFGPDPLAGVT
jgi:uncharacterized membrane protein YhaH (DUF805 family)